MEKTNEEFFEKDKFFDELFNKNDEEKEGTISITLKQFKLFIFNSGYKFGYEKAVSEILENYELVKK